jgi:hypothetical protein
MLLFAVMLIGAPALAQGYGQYPGQYPTIDPYFWVPQSIRDAPGNFYNDVTGPIYFIYQNWNYPIAGNYDPATGNYDWYGWPAGQERYIPNLNPPMPRFYTPPGM